MSLLGLAALCGCFAGIQRRLEQDLRRRVSFDLSCPPEAVQLTELQRVAFNREIVGAYGVTGCGSQATYVLDWQSQTWLLNARPTPAAGWGAAEPPGVTRAPSAPAVPPVPTPPPPTPPPQQPATVVLIGPVEQGAPSGEDPDAPPLPQSPSRTDIQGALRGMNDQVRACLGGGAASARTEIEIRGATGRVTKITVITDRGTDAATCIGQVLLGVVFPRFAQESLTVRYPWGP